jgi:voltage-gated potassium channel
VRRYLARVADRARLVELTFVGLALVLGGAMTAMFVAPFDGFADALWWSLNLFTTVAYVEHVPLGTAGRIVGGVLMVTGVGFVGVFTASLANALLKEPEESPEDDEPETPVD